MAKGIVAFVLLIGATLLLNARSSAQAQTEEQASAARSGSGCGPADVEFDVNTDKKQHPTPQPEAGKALVFVLEQEKTDQNLFKIGAVTTRVGLDGAWKGANHGSSYFFFQVDPGEHRLCAQWQSSLGRFSKLGSALTFNAENGKAYYFQVTVDERKEHPPAVKLESIDVAEGQFLIGSSALSSSRAKTKPSDTTDQTADSR